MKEIIEQTFGECILEGHLGGWCYGGDNGTYYPIMWEYLVNKFNIKSVIDIGCGRGYSTKFFHSLGCDVLGVDGSKIAQNSFLLPDKFLLHDYNNGKTNLEKKFDLAWSCEFVEHVEQKYIDNYINDIKKCKYLAMTFAGIGQTGHHHVNENTEMYWIENFTKNGFIFNQDETRKLREKTQEDVLEKNKNPNCQFFIPHFLYRGLFFINKNI